MKKIFTLLFFAVAMCFAANASDLPEVDRCINFLLHNGPQNTLMAPANANLDANNDGIINISDVTELINQALKEQNVKRAPAKDIDVDAMIDAALKTKTGEPDINDISDAIDHNLKNRK